MLIGLMALDHYVSQVHLKRFCSQDTGGLMHAIRKSDLLRFTPRTRDVCRIDEGNTNAFLSEPRAVEEFLKGIEPIYNNAVSALEAGTPDQQSIYVVAGFASYVMTCSPAAMRISSTLLKGVVEMTAECLDRQGRIPSPLGELGGNNLTNLLDSGMIEVKLNPRYPQAIGITNILQLTDIFGNCRWDILMNDHNDCPFFTSDYPVGIEPTQDARVLNRIVPLTPTMAVRFQPDINRPRNIANFEFRNFSFERRKLTRQEVIKINRILVRVAEDTVFFRDDRPWVYEFVDKNRHFRMETENVQIPWLTGISQFSRQVIAHFKRG